MDSIEMLRVKNDIAALKNSQQTFETKTGQLRNVRTGEISTTRTFFSAAQAMDFCKKHSAVLVRTV
jgi:hypothetical protein